MKPSFRTFRKSLVGIVSILALSSVSAMAADNTTNTVAVATPPDAVKKQLERLVGDHGKVGAVTLLPQVGLYEAVIDKNLIYVTTDGKFFISGNLFKFPEKPGEQPENLTEERVASLMKLSDSDMKEVRERAKTDAMVTVKGDGSRVLYVFSDPDCPYCKQLQSMSIDSPELNNVTIYTFFFPIAQIHPDSAKHAVAIWCSGDQKKRNAVWDAALTKNHYPKLKLGKTGACDNPVLKNIEFGQKLGVAGTPYLVFDNGNVAPSALPADQINRTIDDSKK